jgi:Thioesterase-like superfamily
VSPTGFAEALDKVQRTGATTFEVDLDPSWTVLGKPNGGYLVAVLARCARDVVTEQRPIQDVCVAASTNYSGASDTGPASVEIAIERVGKGASHVRATLTQGERIPVESLMVFGTLGGEARRYDSTSAPVLPPRDACIGSPMAQEGQEAVGILAGTEMRFDPAFMDWSQGTDGRAELVGWARFYDQSPIDALSLHYFLDCFPPATFPIGSSGWVPTLQLTTYVRDTPVGEWLKIRQYGQVVADGFVDEVCEIYDERDRLVGQATQLAMVRF